MRVQGVYQDERLRGADGSEAHPCALEVHPRRAF